MDLTYMKDKLPEFSGRNSQDFIERAKARSSTTKTLPAAMIALYRYGTVSKLQDGDPRKSGPTKTTSHVQMQELRLCIQSKEICSTDKLCATVVATLCMIFESKLWKRARHVYLCRCR
jgi:hypothetical protein